MLKRALIFFTIALASSTLLLANTLYGYLTERAGWTFLAKSSGVTVTPVVPAGIVPLNDERIFYGQLTIGDSIVNLAIMNVEPPILWIDSDFDGCFLNNIPVKGQYRSTVINERRAYKFDYQLRVEYLSNGKSSYLTQDLQVQAILPKIHSVEVDYLLMSRREGLLEVDGELIKLALFPSTADGLANKIDEVFLGIDYDKDGNIDIVHWNYEIFEANSVVEINGKNYKISEISRDGRKVTFSEVNESAQNKLPLKKNSAAPRFEARDIYGKTFAMEDYIGSPIIVVVTGKSPLEVFTDGAPCDTGDCPDTSREMARLKDLLNGLVRWNEYSNKPRIELIWLYSGEEISSTDSMEEYSWLHVIADEAAVKLYSSPLPNGVFLISKKGEIAYLDDYVLQIREDSMPSYPVFRVPTFGMTSSIWFREFVFND